MNNEKQSLLSLEMCFFTIVILRSRHIDVRKDLFILLSASPQT